MMRPSLPSLHLPLGIDCVALGLTVCLNDTDVTLMQKQWLFSRRGGEEPCCQPFSP